MTGKTRLALAGLLAGSLALGTASMRAEARPSPQDLPRPQQQGGSTGTDDTGTGTTQDAETLDPSRTNDTGDTSTRDEPGTGGAGTTQDEDTVDEGTGGSDTTRDEGTLDEPGTGGAGADDMTDDPALDEPGTGGAGDTGQDRVGDEDEGVIRDEGLDHQEGQADQDTVNPPGTNQQQR